MRILAKVGGAQLESGEGRAAFAASVAEVHAEGHEVIVVHGGGNQIRAQSARLGIPEVYHRGLRVTDAETAEVVLMVLGGTVNRRLVQALQTQGVRAVGLTGADGGSYCAAVHRPEGRDLGFVGRVDAVDPQLIGLLLRENYVPVLATTAPTAAPPSPAPADGSGSEVFYNINADMAAGPLGAALGAEVLLFLTDVAGVLDASGTRLTQLTPEDCARLERDGVIAGGMLPKVAAALAAVRAHPDGLIKIAPSAGTHAVKAALSPDVGTAFALEQAHG